MIININIKINFHLSMTFSSRFPPHLLIPLVVCPYNNESTQSPYTTFGVPQIAQSRVSLPITLIVILYEPNERIESTHTLKLFMFIVTLTDTFEAMYPL